MAKKSRHTDPKPKSVGRPEKPIDWDYVDKLIVAGCQANQIAPHFNLTAQQFCYRLEDKYGTNFSTYSSQLAPKGESLILEKQLEKALYKEGDNTMLIWLGKIRCQQKESMEIEIGKEAQEAFTKTMSWFKKKQEDHKANSSIDQNNTENI